jgi:hypothetical protein
MSLTAVQIDEMLECILRAAGSSLRHYMPSSKDNMRKAMREVADAAIAASKSGGSDA